MKPFFTILSDPHFGQLNFSSLIQLSLHTFYTYHYIFGTTPSQPLHLVIEGQTGSGKTKLAKELNVHTEVWRSFNFPEDYSIVPTADVYQNCNSIDEPLPEIWQERAKYWQQNEALLSTIIVDEAPSFRHLNSNNFLSHYLNSQSGQNNNIILITQNYNALQAMTYHFPEIQEDAQSNPFEKFFAILLGTHAKNYAENILKSQSLVEQIKAVKYPCLIGDKLVDLAKSEI